MENLCSNLLPFKILLGFFFCPVIRIVFSLTRSSKQFLKFFLFTEARNKLASGAAFLPETVENFQYFIPDYEKFKIFT